MRWAGRVPLHLGLPVALAAGVRLAHFLFLAARDPLFRHPVVDSLYHAREALAILERGVLLPGSGAFYKGPLYSYILAADFAAFGAAAGVAAGRLFSLLCGCAAVYLAARIAERLGGPRAAMIAGVAFALYGTAVFYDTALLQVSLTVLLLLAAADRLMAAGAGARPERRLACAGALLGLLALARADGLLALAGGAVWAAFAARRGAWPGLGAARALALVVVPAVVVIAPATFRNAVLERDPVLISWNGGINLFMGNDPAFDQASGNWHPDLSWMRLYDAPADLGLARGADHQRFFVRQALGAALEHPARTARILARKALLLFGAYEIANNQRYDEARAHSPVLAVLMFHAGRFSLPFSVAGPLLAAGLVLAAGRLRAPAGPLAALATAWALTPVLFFNTARFRLPAILLLLPLAAAGWAARPAAGDRRRAGLAAGAALLVLAVGIATFPAHPQLPPSEELNLADVADQEGREADALAWRRRAVERDPRDPLARVRLADTLRVNGRCDEALAHYAAVTERDDLAAEWRLAAIRSMARCLAALGRPAQAVDWYERFLAADPDQPRTGTRPDFHLRGVPPLQAC
nr:tetratricopeptide repeat protein [Acidobacteriota bacterium]